jgi:hypothetical protein
VTNELLELDKPDRSDSPRYFTGAKAESGVADNSSTGPVFLKILIYCPGIASITHIISRQRIRI